MTREEIIRRADERLELGKKKYGDFDPITSSRDMIEEMTQELLDVMNYASFMIQQLQCLGKTGLRATVRGGRLCIEMPMIPEEEKL
jgi:hypothetical protein